MALRDDLLPVVNLGSELAKEFGLSRYTVTVRVRTWLSGTVGDDSAGHTDDDFAIDPSPDVNLMSPVEMQRAGIMTSTGQIEDRYWVLSSITPAYIDPATNLPDGNTPLQLAPVVGENQELLYLLTGDDGITLECTLVLKEFDDPFEYVITVQEKRRRTLQSAP